MIAIIGAGPVGAYAAKILAEDGHDVHVFEEHTDVGKPIQCTGVLSKNLLELLPKDACKHFTVNTLKGAILHAPNASVEIRTDKIQAYLVDRHRFDTYLVQLSVQAGAKLHLDHKLTELKERLDGKIDLKFRNGRTLVADKVVGADGPFSTVARHAGLLQKRKALRSIQVRVKGNFTPDLAQLYLGSVCPDFFAWIAPENEHYARVGLATNGDVSLLFNQFVKRLGAEVIEHQGGPIPVYAPIRYQKGNIYLVGDAALHIKNTTGGGIITGLHAARELAKSIRTGKDYQKLVMKAIGKDLKLTQMIRNKLNRFQDRHYDEIVRTLSKPNILKDLKELGDMDFPTRFLAKLLFRNPTLLKYVWI